MPAELVRRAIEQARARDPLIRVAALLYGSRVLAALDGNAAKAAFAEGVAGMQGLTFAEERYWEFLRHEAVRMGASADPVAALAVFRTSPVRELRLPRESLAAMLVQGLAKEGELELATGLLRDPVCPSFAGNSLMVASDDPELHRSVLRATREAWQGRNQDPGRRDWRPEDFHRFFSQHWEKLEPREAGEWLDEMLLRIESDPDQPTNSGFGNRVQLHSMRAARIFEVLNLVRALRPARVEALIRANPELGGAVEMYPEGLATLMAQPRPAAPGRGRGGGASFSGSAGSAAELAMMIAAHRGDPSAVDQMLEEAHRAYLEDNNADNPNVAPRIFWPSCEAYKVAMYWAGKQSGMDAQALLDQIPDRDFQILASIELAGALAGLSHQGGVRTSRHANDGRRY